MTTRRSLATLAAVLLILVAAVALLYVTRAQVPPPAAVSTPIPTATAVTTPPSTTIPPTATPQAGGAITGSFAYGSDFIPAFTVYAISTVDSRVWYSVALPAFGRPPLPTLPPGQTELSYTITGVTPGMYWVVAYRTDGQSPVPAFYSRAVECLRARLLRPCPDHAVAPVTVSPGQTTSGIDVFALAPPPGPTSPTYPPQPTSAPQRPQGYVLPSECQFIDNGAASSSAITWKIACPQGLPSNYLAPSLTAQAWVSCSPKVWQKSGLQIAITDAVNVSGFTGWLDQRPLGGSGCVQTTPPPN